MPIKLDQAVDLYCERLEPGLWAEPVNAFTNAAFLLGAWFTYHLAKQFNLNSKSVRLLTALMCVIAIGSGLFHTFANGLTHILDVVPILLFQLLYVWFYCREVIGMRADSTAGILLVYLVAAITGRQFPEFLNGALIYAPAIVTLFVLGRSHLDARRPQPYVVMVAALLFVLSLGCRTIDALVCPTFPVGTHFLWHLLNAAVLYLLMRGYLAGRNARVPAPP